MTKSIKTIIAAAQTKIRSKKKLSAPKKVSELETLMTDMEGTLDKVQGIRERALDSIAAELDGAAAELKDFKKIRKHIAVLRKKQKALIEEGNEADAKELVRQIRNLIAGILPKKLEIQQ